VYITWLGVNVYTNSMQIANLADVEMYLQCPRCCSPLARKYRCTGCGHQYGTLGPWPVLVDFDQSVLEEHQLTESQGASIISGRNSRGWVGVMRHIFKTRNRYAENNIEQVLGHVPPGGRVLIVGGGAMGEGMQRVYDSTHDIDVFGFDIYGSPNVQLIADAHHIPFQSGLFDAVIVQAVLEHVLSPHSVVEEIWRVLKTDGWVYSETPFLQHVHEGPYDFTRFTVSGHRWLFAKFSIIAAGPLDGPAAQLLWSVQYLVWGLTGKRNAGRIARIFFMPLLFLDRLVKREFRVDSTTGSYLIGQRSSHELTPHEAVHYYQGAQ
jgi:SAM-dependent methyltransferase